MRVSATASADEFTDTISIFKNAGESGSFFQKSYAYAVFPTAASMNGYLSANASLSELGMKRSFPAHLPRGVDGQPLVHPAVHLLIAGDDGPREAVNRAGVEGPELIVVPDETEPVQLQLG